MRILVPFVAFVSLAVAAQAASPTSGEVAEGLLGHLLAPIAREVEGEGYAPRIALRAADFAQEDLETSVAGFFFDRGFDVWVLQEEDPLPSEGAVLLDFRLEKASVAYPQTDDGTLGLGSRRLLRQASAAMSGTLDDPLTGRRLWQGSPEARYEDWIAESERDALAADRPSWLVADTTASGAAKAGWKEKAGVLGLLGGVIILYFSGAN